VARGTQHRKRRPTADARVARPEPKKARAAKRPKQASWEDQLFFSRLRAHAKWVFVFLAAVFMLSFVVFGVGSGSGGIGDILQGSNVPTDTIVLGLVAAIGIVFAVLAATGVMNVVVGSGLTVACVAVAILIGSGVVDLPSGTASTSSGVGSLEKKTRDEPKNAQAWRDLSTALQQDNRTEEAIVALTRYTVLKPKDESALQSLGTLYLSRADTFAQEYVAARSRSESLAPGAAFKPQSGSPLEQIFQDPISTAVTASGTTKTGEAYAAYTRSQSDAVGVYKQLAALTPKDATNQYRLATVAQSAGDSQTAIAAYKKFLVLAPNDALAPTAKQALKQLSAPATPSVSAG
jgi:tetratricopeptide (TPR) repeat protein